MTAAAFLVFARSAGFVARAPGLSHPSVPHAVRAGFAAALALVLAPVAARGVHVDGVAFVLALAIEAGIGAAIGIAASILYDGAYAGGRAIDDYTGIRGSVPNAQVYAPSGFGRIWSSVFLAGFFLFGGYRLAIEAFARSFDRLPAGAVPSSHALAAYAVQLPVSIVEAALLVAGPPAAVAFCAQFTLGAISRVVPRFGAFALSFPIVFALAVLTTAVAVPLLFGQSAVPWIRVPLLDKP
ncbi:MAG TPA: flagellar biosynthetic protein FliR [Candidatus Baltobacteraceae bacterium]|nr:flagellar biosynthetic protein FliR [Candidatus Baltobacteraceae bacterium]